MLLLGLALLLGSAGAAPAPAKPASGEPASEPATVAPSVVLPDGRRSGYAWLGEELRSLEDDPFANPGLLWVDRGRVLWVAKVEGSASCADCHGEPDSLRGLAAHLPRWNERTEGLDNLEMLINRCRTERQHQPAWPWESEPLLATTTLLSWVSRGLPIDVDVGGPAAPAFEAGRRAFERRRGQLDLACSNCHEDLAGQRLRGDVISQGMINGFPIYRLTWQTLGSRERMFRWCNESVRAEPHAWGADEYLALELYLAWRARGLPIETPAVRR